MNNLDRFLDCATMRQIFQEQLPGIANHQLQVTDCQLLHSHYYTSVKHAHKARLGLCYQLEGIDQRTGAAWRQLFYARARVNGDSVAEYNAAKAGDLAKPAIGEAVAHLPQHDLTVWAFPNDPAIPHLPWLIDPQQVRSHLPCPVLPAYSSISVEVVHYYPEERCTSRYTINGSDTFSPPTTVVIYGKTFKDGQGERIYRRLCEAWQYTSTRQVNFRVAQPLGYVEALHTIWLRGETGAPLAKTIHARNAATLLDAVAQGLVDLQNSNLLTSGEIGFKFQLAEMEDKVQKLAHALPELTTWLHERVAALRVAATSLPPAQLRLVHGDFHIRQLIVDGGEIIFLDFDEFSLGDPLRDVANFVVDLHFADFAPDFVRQMMLTFIASYQRAVDFSISSARLQWHLRYLFLTKAYRAYRQHKVDLAQIVTHSFALADAACAEIAQLL